MRRLTVDGKLFKQCRAPASHVARAPHRRDRRYNHGMLVAFLSAALVAGLALRLRLLTAGGAVHATWIGTAAVLAGAGWFGLLLLFFVTANLLGRWRAGERRRRTGGIIEKGERRDAWQVLANGGAFGAAAAAGGLGGGPGWAVTGAGAMAAAMADTWSTEVGTVSNATPRLILGGRPVPAGTSGGVTVTGSAAAVCGALLAGFASRFLDSGVPLLAVTAGGIAGALVDSLLGATLQERRWCDHCGTATEQRVHRCGTATRVSGGVAGVTNDMVNLVSTLAGGGIAWLLR